MGAEQTTEEQRYVFKRNAHFVLTLWLVLLDGLGTKCFIYPTLR